MRMFLSLAAQRVWLIATISFCALCTSQTNAQGLPRNDAGIQKALVLRDSLIYFQEQYFNTSLKDPTNKGARELAHRLDSLTTALADYLTGKLNNRGLQKDVQAIQTHAARYKTPLARRLQRNLRQLFNLIPKLPIRVDPPLKEEELRGNTGAGPKRALAAADSAPADSYLAELNTTLAQHTDRTTAAPPDVMPRILGFAALPFMATLGLVLLGAVIGLGVWAVLVYRKQRKLLTEYQDRMAMLEKRLARITENQDDAHSDKPFEILAGEFSKKLDGLEQSLRNVVHRIESRTNVNESLVSNLAGDTAADRQKLEDLLHQFPILRDLTLEVEERLKKLEQQLKEKPATTSATQPVQLTLVPEALPEEALLEPLQQLAERATALPLRELATRLAAVLLKPGSAEERAQVFTPTTLSLLLQQAYIAGRHHNLGDVYPVLAAAAKKLGYTIEDGTQGQRALPASHAYNIPFAEYKQTGTQAVGFTADVVMPQHLVVLAQLERNTMPKAQTGTVLYILTPTVLYTPNGKTAYVARGLYIVK